MGSVFIIGGGPVGALTAFLLVGQGVDVTILHRPRGKDYKAGETLPPVANSLLRHLGLYDLLAAEGHLKCPGNQSAFGSAELVDFDFIFSANGLGWHLDRRAFEETLLKRAVAAGATLHTGKIQALQRDGEGWQIDLASSKTAGMSAEGEAVTLSADALIDASGVARFLLRRKNIAVRHDDKLGARIALFKTQASKPDHRTLIEADVDGWWYSSCAPGNVRLVMFFSDSDLLGFQSCQTREAFLSRLNNTRFIKAKLAHECGDYEDVNTMSFTSESARSSVATRVAGKGWLAIGDAAMSFDPLSSQGLWVGFEAARRAVDAITADLADKSDSAGAAYQAWAQKTYSDYTQEKMKYYAMEQRFMGEEFWQRRQRG